VRSTTLSFVVVLGTMAIVPLVHAAEPAPVNVAEIQAKHDRAFIRELSDYLRQNPKAEDRDQAYAALFNKAIEHDWFSEAEEQGRHYLNSDPEGPVKALAQIILTMGRAQAGQFDEALKRFRELMQGIGQNEQEEFAASFADNLATAAITAGEFGIAREVYTALLSRFSDSPNLRQKVQRDLKRLDKVGKPAPSFTSEDINGKAVRLDAYRGKYVLIDFWATWCAPCIGELPRLQAAYRTYHDAGFAIIGVSLDESKTAVVDFARARNLPWPQLHNASGSADLVEGFGVSSIPATYLIDPEGTVIRLDLRGKALDETLNRLIKSPVKTTRRP
jgi:peroxiredoxin/predicted negative regulator of RcsB-dependent stress response